MSSCQLWSPHKVREIAAATSIHTQDWHWSFPWLLGLTQTLELVLSTKTTREMYNHIHLENSGREGAKPNTSKWGGHPEQGINSQGWGGFAKENQLTASPKELKQSRQRVSVIQHPDYSSAFQDQSDTTECSTETFKRRLDMVLQEIPDEPPIPHGPTYRVAGSNSIIEHWLDPIPLRLSESGKGGSPDWMLSAYIKTTTR